MTRITSTILIFMILLNGSAGIMEASGLSEDLGVQIAPGISEAVNDAVDNLREGFNPSAGIGETLYTLFIAALQTVEIVVSAITAAPTMFLNLGFPGWMVYPLALPLYVVSTLEMMYVATGRDMI